MPDADVPLPTSGKRQFLLSLASVVALVICSVPFGSGAVVRAHKELISNYTYNEHVFPILRDKCAACHASGGPSPMSLMTYQDAVPWADSLREEVTTERMPPWSIDPAGPKLIGAHALTAKEVDVLITWASGGTPEGPEAAAPPPFNMSHDWRAGTPDQILPIPEDFTLRPGVDEAEHEFSVRTELGAPAWLRAVDFLPGTPALVRSATIAIKDGPILATWLPGVDVSQAPEGAGFRLPAAAVLSVHINYKKPWQELQKALSDRSALGLYLSTATSTIHPIETVLFTSSSRGEDAREPRVFGGSTTEPARLLALRLNLDRPYASIEVKAKRPDGATVPLLHLRKARPAWVRRYWFADAIDTPAGTRFEVIAIPVASGGTTAERGASRGSNPLALEICVAEPISAAPEKQAR